MPTSGPTSGPTFETGSSSATSCEVELEYEESDIDWPANAGPEIVQVDNSGVLVTVRFKQTFETASGTSSQGDCEGGQIDWVAFVSEDENLNEVCTRSESLCYGDSIETTVQCDANDNFAILTVYVSDDHASFSTSENGNPGSCEQWTHNDTNVAKFKFMIPCNAECSELSPPRELSTEAAMKENRKPPNSGHYCSKEDFPCGMENESVHVCHYSARSGYQSFCVSEEDTDMLAYYPRDYCGPCYGGLDGLGA
jgi:hypothetical protein